jgi:hypothetical protein
MVHEDGWYYSAGGQEKQGPMAWEQVEAAFKAGLIGPASYLWAPHLPDWVPANTLLSAQTVPPPLPPPAAAPASAPLAAATVRMPIPVTILTEAPGAKAGRNCGIWALITAFLCFPMALVLAIIAIVQTNKASRRSKAAPNVYLQPSGSGRIMGIIVLVGIIPLMALAGMISAIAIPAMLGQRDRARDRTAIANLEGLTADMVAQYDRLNEVNPSPQAIQSGLEAFLQESAATSKNPWNMRSPAYAYTTSRWSKGSRRTRCRQPPRPRPPNWASAST